MMAHKSARENVAYHSDINEISKIVVQMWLDSPGHFKNIVSGSKFSAVAAYYSSSNNSYYFT